MLTFLAVGWGAAGRVAAQAGGAPDFAAVDRHALAAPPAAERSLNALAEYLTGPYRGDTEKARAIFRWITANVAYDAQAYFSGSFRNLAGDAETILENRMGVCDGYAELFLALASRAGLETEKVSGHAKGAGYHVGDSFAGKDTNHAWNAVKIGGAWRLLDATWAAGNVKVKEQKFVRRFEETYFLTPPETMAYSHFPEKKRWLLLSRPLTLAEFEKRAFLRPAFFRDGLGLASHPWNTIDAPEEVTVKLKAPPQTRLTAQVLKDGRRLGRAFAYVEPGNGEVAVHALFPEPGEYTLRLFSQGNPAKKELGWSADYLVRARQGTPRRFPKFGQSFFRDGLVLETHPGGIIESDGKVDVTLRAAPGVELTADLHEGERSLPGRLVFVQKSEGGARVLARLPRAGTYSLRIFSRPPGAGNRYDFALDYELRVTGGLGAGAGFPTIYSGFSSRGATLVAPIEGTLPVGRPVRFAVRVPGATVVAVENGKDWHQLKNSGEGFEGEVMLQAGRVRVWAQFSGKGAFDGLLDYSAR